MKRRILAIVGICVILCTFVFAFPSSADGFDTYIYRQFVNLGSQFDFSPHGYDTDFYVLVDDIRYYSVGLSDSSYSLWGENSLFILELTDGVEIHLTRDISEYDIVAQHFFTECCEKVDNSWKADETSVYTQIYSTVQHYLFSDTLENVPFGSFWVSGISIIALLFVVAVPFLLIFWTIRFIGG